MSLEEWGAPGAEAGVVGVGVAGLRREPAHAAELLSQGLLGEAFRVLEVTPGADWLRVRMDGDGYVGWLRAWSAVRGAADWTTQAAVRVAAREVQVREAPRRGARALVVAPWQARLRSGDTVGAWVEVGLPDGRRGYAPRVALTRGPAPGGAPTPARLVRTAERLLGTPYLWGGRSTWGFDCSGVIQAIFAWHGVDLPRDSRDQFRVVAAGSGGDRRRATASGQPSGAGSLLFFGSAQGEVGHVALGTGEREFIHAYGQVSRGSLSPSSQSYVEKLVTQYLGTRKWPS